MTKAGHHETVLIDRGLLLLIAVVTGTRPQIIKSAPVLNAFDESGINYDFIHTGQHYDYELAGAFIEEFELTPPKNLEIGSNEPIKQTTKIIERLDLHFKKHRPNYVIVPGDTTSALAAAFVGFKMDIPVCHLESGLRRYDYRYQEEINRRLIDHGSSALFTPTETARKNLELEDVLGTIYHIGDTMYDVLKRKIPYICDKENNERTKARLGIDADKIALLTLHRRENVDSRENLASIVSAINSFDVPIVFPIHPRTKKHLDHFSLKLDKNHVQIIDPISHNDFLSLVSSSKLVISDSGGVQKECFVLNIPIVSLHTRTEWIETVDAGANTLTPINAEDILASCSKMYGTHLSNDSSVYGDGNAALKIPPILESREIQLPTDRKKNPFADYFKK